MTWHYRDLALDKIGIIGSGQIGPDIALHFTRVVHQHGVSVVVVDISDAALDAGRARVEKKVRKGQETGAFKPARADAMLANLTFTTDYNALAGAGLIIEAATENAAIKASIFGQVQTLCPDAVLASNSSHMQPEEIFGALPRRERCLVIHYFYPAERNPMVEIVPGCDTDAGLVETLLGFYEQIGKVAIRVGSRYGYAIDPIFEGLFLAAALLVESGMGSVKEVDVAAAAALGLTVGPFTAMNLTGGNPITHHGLTEMGKRFGNWWRSPELMQQAVDSGAKWEVAARGEKVDLPTERSAAIAQRMQGAYFGLAGQVLDSGITNVADLEMALEVGLDIRPPFAMMNAAGPAHALELVRDYAARYPGFAVPECLQRQAASVEPWSIDHVLRHDVDGIAVLTIRRPRVLNALNGAVYEQLQRHVDAIRNDDAICGVVLTGYGTKAFVSGADVNFLAGIRSPEEGFTTSMASKEVGNRIESLGKPVICAMNGPAIGGGNELAMCCTARVCREGLKVAAQQPEVNLGIIPGAGATQRLPRLIDIRHAAAMLRTGRAISAEEAVAAGLVYRQVPGDVVEFARHLARDVADGRVTLPAMNTGPMTMPDELPGVDLNHLSHLVDRILCDAIIRGCRMPLPDGLRYESEAFARCCETRDMSIGIRNFLEHGVRSPAEFVNA